MDLPVMGILFVVISTLAFEGLLFGSEIAADTFGDIVSPEEQDCSGFLDGVACVFTFIFDVFETIFAGIVFLFRLITFDVPGAPWWVKVPVAGLLGGGIILVVIQVFRGN